MNLLGYRRKHKGHNFQAVGHKSQGEAWCWAPWYKNFAFLLINLHFFRSGEPNDYDALKAHPFFAGINFENLMNTKPPIADSKYSFKSKMVIEELPVEFAFAKARAIEKAQAAENTKEVNLAETQEKSAHQSSLSPGKSDQSPKSLKAFGTGNTILQGQIAKRQPYFFYYQTRILILSDEPRLYYKKPETGEIRVITLMKNLHSN